MGKLFMDKYEEPDEESIEILQKEGHTYHCACRIVWGDGECECDKADKIPGPVSSLMYNGVCYICLAKEGKIHEPWCRSAGKECKSMYTLWQKLMVAINVCLKLRRERKDAEK